GRRQPAWWAGRRPSPRFGRGTGTRTRAATFLISRSPTHGRAGRSVARSRPDASTDSGFQFVYRKLHVCTVSRSSRLGPSDPGRQDPSRPTVLQRRQITGDDQYANLPLAVASNWATRVTVYHFGDNDTSSDMGHVPPASSAGWRGPGGRAPPPVRLVGGCGLGLPRSGRVGPSARPSRPGLRTAGGACLPYGP